MQLIERKGITETNDDNSKQKIVFNIQLSAKSIGILSSGLYSDKIKAVIRELSTNAADSHILAGNDSQFDIILPNSLNPNFVIRDYGTGLSPDDVVTTYTQYFASNKTHTNNLNGCLGLGSKSPFAYTNNFIVESFFGGIHYTYFLYKNEDNMPVMDLKHECKSDEHAGVRITIAVKPEDFYSFRTKAAEVFLFFKVRPKISGAQCDIPTLSFLLQKEEWSLRAKDNLLSYSGPLAVMGNIAYPIKIEDHKLTETQKELLDTAIIINFPIGSLNIEAGRESLGYDARTIRAIARKCDEIINEIAVTLNQEIAACSTLWQARVKYLETLKLFSSDMFSDDKIEYNGIPLGYGQNVQYNIGEDDEISKIYHCTRYSSYRHNTKITKKNYTNYVNIGSEVTFILGDIKNAYPRVRQYLLGNPTKEVYFCIFVDAVTQQDFMNTIGISDTDFILASSLPSPTANRSKVSASRHKMTEVSTYKYNDGVVASWENSSVDLSVGGIYVDLKRGSVLRNGSYVHPQVINNLIQNIKRLGIEVPIIYGIKSATVVRAHKVGLWVEFFDWCKDKLANEMKSFDPILTLKAWQAKQYFDQSNYEKIGVFSLKEIGELLKVPNIYFDNLIKFYTEINVSCDDFQKANNINALYFSINEKEIVVQPQLDIAKSLYRDVVSRYDIFRFLMSKKVYFGSINKSDCRFIADYIDLTETNLQKTSK